jgi:hypothetical protein
MLRQGRRGRGFEHGAEDTGVGQDAPVVDEAQAGAGREGWVGGLVFMCAGGGSVVQEREAAADEVLQRDDGGLVRRGDVEV